MAKAKLSGFRRLPGAARRYVGPGGQTLSYRQYRKAVERAGAVKRLEAADLERRRVSQREFNRVIQQMADVRKRAIEAELNYIEYALDEGEIDDDDAAELIADLKAQSSHLKSQALKSPARKEALQDLKRYGHEARRKHLSPAQWKAKYPEHERALRQALEILGRREGVDPDVIPGESGKRRDFRIAA